MIHQKIDPLETIRCDDHDHPVQRGIKPFKGNGSPLFHLIRCMALLPSGKIKECNVSYFPVGNVLIHLAVLILRKTQPHGLASGIRLVNGFLQRAKVQTLLNGQAGADIQYLLFRAVFLVEKVQLLCCSQRIQWFAKFLFHMSNSSLIYTGTASPVLPSPVTDASASPVLPSLITDSSASPAVSRNSVSFCSYSACSL